MSEQLHQKTLFIVKEIALVGVVFVAAYVLSQNVNAWLGQRAIDNTGINYLEYNEALSLSAETGKPVMVQFSSILCSKCRKLDAQVFSEAAVRNKIDSDYLFTRLEWKSENDKEIFDQFGVRAFPVILILDNSSDSVKRMPATFNADHFLQLI